MAPFPKLELFNDRKSTNSTLKTFLLYHFFILIGFPLQATFPFLANPLFSTATFLKLLQISYCYLASENLKTAFFWFLLFHLSTGYTFLLQSMNAAHHHTSIFHDNGSRKFEGKVDFGWFQLQATKDRKETVKKWWLSPLVFGDHQLHHLFPTIDAGRLPELYPIFEKTVKEFGYEESTVKFSAMEMAGKSGIIRQLQKIG